MAEIRNGKKPLSTKAPMPTIGLEDIFGNTLGIDPELAKEIKAQGLAMRFISGKKLAEMGGYHPFGWKPYKREGAKIDTTHSFLQGNAPDGLIHRGDCILAVRPIELNNKHKDYLKQEAKRVAAAATSKAHAAKLRELSRESGINAVVEDTYEDAGEEESN